MIYMIFTYITYGMHTCVFHIPKLEGMHFHFHMTVKTISYFNMYKNIILYLF